MPPRKRARDEEQHIEADLQSRRSRRDRNSGDGVPFWMKGAQTSNSATPERSALVESSTSQAQNQRKRKGGKEEAGPLRKRKRLSPAKGEGNQAPARAKGPAASQEKQDKAVPHGRPRKSGHDEGSGSAAKTRAQGQGAPPKQRGRPRRSDLEDGSGAAGKRLAQGQEAPLKQRGRPRRSDLEDGSGLAGKRRAEEQVPQPVLANEEQRRRLKPKGQPRIPEVDIGEEQESEASEARPARVAVKGGFYRLEPQTRKVPLPTVTATWTPLAEASRSGIKGHLNDAANSVAASLHFKRDSDDPLYSEVKAISTRIFKNSRKMNFPTGPRNRGSSGRWGQEDQLNYARVVSLKDASEQQLGPLQHSTALLEKEISKWEKTVAKEYEALRELETNARQESRDWRDKAKRGHVLAPEAKPGVVLDQNKTSQSLGSIFEDKPDPEFRALSKQVESHMESMAGNLQQVKGITTAIRASKGVLEDVLIDRLGSKDYEDVVFGGIKI